MAVFHKSSSYLLSKAFVNLALAILFILPVALYFYCFAKYHFHFDSFYHLIPVLLAVPANYYAGQFFKLVSGANGESVAKRAIKKLPDSYHVFKNLHLEHEGKECEIDLLVIGNNGIFAVEVKNHNGRISGDANAECWEQEKTGKKGGIYTKSMKNPIKQIKRSVYILSRVLEQNQLRSWITPMVLFTNQSSGLDVISKELYTSGETLVNEIQTTHSRETLDNTKINRLKDLLIRESAKSKRASFLSEVVLTKSNAIAVVLFAVIIGIYSQLPFKDSRHPQSQTVTIQKIIQQLQQ
jgi:Nuclease-related domain.